MKFIHQLLALAIFTAPLISHGQDLSGTWEGEFEGRGNTKYDITLYLTKSGDNIYSGVSVTKMKKTGKGNDILRGGNISLGGIGKALKKNPSSTNRLFGTNTNSKLQLAKLSVIEAPTENMGWDFGSQPISLAVEGEDHLTASGSYAFSLKKKNNNYPSEYSAYAITKLVTVNSIDFKSSKKTNKITYNDKGIVSMSFTNHTDIDLQPIQLSFYSNEIAAGIIGLEKKINSTLNLTKGQTTEGEIDIHSNFALTAKPIRFIVEGSYRGASLFKQEFEVQTEPFYLTDKTVLNDNSKRVYPVLAGFYGLNKTNATPVATNLNQFVASGNPYAPMYKAIFLKTGWGDMPMDDAQGQQLAQKASPAIINAARNGDAEAQYLMFYVIGMDLADGAGRAEAGEFLKRAAEVEFLPAMYDYASYLQKAGEFSESLDLFKKCYDKGLQKAALNIGYMYRKGSAGEKDMNKAVQWLLKANEFGDPSALMQLAYIYTDGDDIEPDAQKAIGYVNKAIARKNTAAMNFLAGIYLTGRSGVTKNETKALELFKQAAAANDNAAMTSLAYLFLEGRSSVFPKDEKMAFFWAKKSAESGGAESMALLANLYEEGKVAEKNIIKSRFWANQAYLNGVGKKDDKAENVQAQEMSSIINGIDFSDQYSLWRSESGNLYEVNEGADPIGSLISSTFQTVLSRRSNQQQVINGLEYIYTSNGKKIYGGTLTSKLTTNISMKTGTELVIKAYGTVNLGTFAGVSGPNGIYGFQSYSMVPGISHAAIIGGVNEWILVGATSRYKASADGKFQIGINDTDYSNNIGYFDVVIEVQN